MAELRFPRRGEIYWVNLDPTVGSEIRKTRPALIISNDVGNCYSALVIVAPVTSQGVARAYPFEVAVPPGIAGLTRPSKVLLDQIRTVDKARLGECMGNLPPDLMDQVDAAIRLSLAV